MSILSRVKYFFAADAAPSRPDIGERTKTQRAGTIGGDIPGFLTTEASSYALYRRMSADPTLAVVRMVVISPVLAGSWSFKSQPDVLEERVDFIRDMIDPMRPSSLKDSLRSLEFGFQAFEKVWEVVDGKLILKKLKPLLPENTTILVHGDGAFAGIRNNGVELGPEKCLVITYDGEAGNFYGRSRHENARKEFAKREQVDNKSAQYSGKIAGVNMQIHYPEGHSLDANGVDVDNSVLAVRLMTAYADGRGACFPNLFALGDPKADLSNAANLAGKSQWIVTYNDAGGASHAAGFIEKLRYHDSRLFRAWLRPERSALEGQFGTKAEAETHGDIGVLDGELLYGDIVRQLNWYVIDEILAYNFGEDARGSVYIEPAPLADTAYAVLERVLDAILANPGTLEELLTQLDADSLAQALKLPVVDKLNFTGGSVSEPVKPPLSPQEQAKQQARMDALYTGADAARKAEEAGAAAVTVKAGAGD
jgi:hypothetical protein